MTETHPSDDTKRAVAHAALAVGLVAAALTLVLCALLTATHLQLKRADPLNNETLVSLRNRYEAGERDDQTKSDIRDLDFLARKAFFVSQSQILTGGLIAILSGAVMLVALGVFQVATKRIPPPPEESCEGMFWINLERSRVWIACGTVLLAAMSVVMALSTPTSLTSELATAPATGGPTAGEQPDPMTQPGPEIVPESKAPVFPKDFAQNAPVFRGAACSGQTDFEAVPTEWDEKTKKNMLWKTPLPLPAWAAPVVWGNKVVALGADKDKREVYCLDAETGESAWITPVPENEAATEEYVTDTMDDRWNTLVYAGATPAVNGKSVFALFSNGQLLALNLEDGNVLWNIVPGKTSENLYGVDNSLLIYRDSVLVAFQGDEAFIARYDAATGKEIWKTERTSASWGSPVMAKTADGAYLVVLFGDPDVTAWDPETGMQVWSTKVVTESPDYCIGPSAVLAGDMVCVNFQNMGMAGVNLADGKTTWHLDELPDGSSFADGASMTTDGKHIYQYYESTLTCVDAATGEVVKQKDIDEYANYASALLNKGNLYLFGDGVANIVNSDPATDFAPVGTGAMEEYSDSTPAIVEGRIYVRSDKSLYCFGTK